MLGQTNKQTNEHQNRDYNFIYIDEEKLNGLREYIYLC